MAVAVAVAVAVAAVGGDSAPELHPKLLSALPLALTTRRETRLAAGLLLMAQGVGASSVNEETEKGFSFQFVVMVGLLMWAAGLAQAYVCRRFCGCAGRPCTTCSTGTQTGTGITAQAKAHPRPQIVRPLVLTETLRVTVSPHGECWHCEAECAGLRLARSKSTRVPCSICCPRFLAE